MREGEYDRIEPIPEFEDEWNDHVVEMFNYSLFGTAKSWFTGYNSNVDGHDKLRYLIYNGGAPRFRNKLAEVADADYRGFNLT